MPAVAPPAPKESPTARQAPPPPSPVVEPQSPVRGGTRATFRLPDAASLHQAKKNVHVETGGQPETRAKAFTREQLIQVWAQFAESRRSLVAEYQVLTQAITVNDANVQLTLTNPAQETLLGSLKLELVTFLRETLQNDSIQVEGVVVVEEGKKMIYGADEKLQYLSDKNPVIRELTKRFGLDPDF